MKGQKMNLFRANIIDRSSAIPLYFQLYSYIEKLIEKDELKDGDRLPTEDELVTQLGISRQTIRQAYKELSSKGFIRRERSKGTVVTKPMVYDKFLSELTSFRNELEASGAVVKTKVLEFKVEDESTKVKDCLLCDKYIHLKRVRYCDDIPVVYMDSYIPYYKYINMLDCNMERESLYDQMEKAGYPVFSVSRNISAKKAKTEEAKYLEMAKGDPILFTETIGKDKGGVPIEYSVANYNGKKTNFNIELKLSGINK